MVRRQGRGLGIVCLLLGHIVCVMLSVSAYAQSEASYFDARKRTALILGVGAYDNAPPLVNPKNDVTAVSARLREIGFSVTTALDPMAADAAQIIDGFVRASQDADIALVYYSGHGVQVDGENYLIPRDFNPTTGGTANLIQVNALLDALDKAAKAKVLLLDACRDNPFVAALEKSLGGRSVGRGLAPMTMTAPVREANAGAYGVLIGYATQANTVAFDGDGATSPYARGILLAAQHADEDLNSVLVKAAAIVVAESKGRQRPEHRVALTQPLFLLSRAAPLRCDVLAGDPDNHAFVAGVEMDSIDAMRAIEACRADLAQLPNNARLLHNLGRALEKAGRIDEAMGNYFKSAALGHDNAQNVLGVMLLLGRGVKQDVPEAMRQFRAAYRQGNRNATLMYATEERSGLFKTSPRRTRELQAALLRAEATTLPPNGNFDAPTEQAIAKFKRDHGLTGRGLTFQVIDELGLTEKLVGR
jgi:uncharacterized caspase-like protein